MRPHHRPGRSLALACCALLLALPCAAPVAQQVTAECAAAAGRDITARDIIINCGLTEEQVRTLVRELREQENPALQMVADLSRELGVTQSAVQNFFRILGEQRVPDERLLETLALVAERHIDLLAQAQTVRSDDPAIQALREAAAAAIERADYDRAEALLAEAEAAELRAAREAQEEAERRLLNAAATRAERGQLSMTQLDYLTAAEHFREAAALAPASALEDRADYLNRYAGALQQHGDERGDNAVLRQAIEAYRDILAGLPRERVPLDWAMTQNNLGNALAVLGERESGTARLEQAVAAYEAALLEYTRERVPLAWAATQTNLGNALATLGERESGTARLEQAVAAYRAALAERTRERVPLAWAQTQNNLGLALAVLGERVGRPDLLEEALAAVEGAFEVYTAAGFRHYEADFRDRIQALKGAIEQAKRAS